MDKRDSVLEIIRKKTCHICKHVLSVPPIVIEGTKTELYKCGRCKDIRSKTRDNKRVQRNCQQPINYFKHPQSNLTDTPNSYRINLFEEVAQHLSFPCSYPGCHKVLSWGSAERHERNCRYKTISCPMIFSRYCSETILVNDLGNHFREKHQHSIKKAGDIIYAYDYFMFRTGEAFLLEAGDEYFIVYILGRENIAVLAPKQSNYNKFNVEMLPGSKKDFGMSFKNLPLAQYNERMHCMCELDHRFSMINSDDMQLNLLGFVKLRTQFLSDYLPEKLVGYRITLIAKPEELGNQEDDKDEQKDEETHGTDKIQSLSKIESVKRELRCPYCFYYLVPPIYSCNTGHAVCHNCKNRLKKCPICSSPFGEHRLFSLEEIVRHIEVPCENNREGCNFRSTVLQMSDHEETCDPSKKWEQNQNPKVNDKINPKLYSCLWKSKLFSHIY